MSAITVEKMGPVPVVTLDRPQVRNAAGARRFAGGDGRHGRFPS